ncbi:MAG TPA: DUF3568 family protein [Planctomycetota bacterium]|nr:DUF3568 family protein [Planctomycetota bacterium]
MKYSTAGLAVILLALAACSSDDKTSSTKQGDLGTGVNTIDRQYGRSASDTWDAAEAAIKAYDITIESDAHDSMGGELRAHRASGDKVVIRVKSLDDKHSDVTVRVEPGNRNMAEMIHEKIADKLGLKEAKSAFFGGNTCEGRYPHPLEVCVKAAEDAARRLEMTVTHKDVSDEKAVVDARDGNSNPVQFYMKKVDKGVQITFIAGREKNDAMRDLCYRMKSEFENCCASKSD